MIQQRVILVCSVLALCAVGGARAGVFSDSFDTAHDYLADGAGDTGWDGFVGSEPGETASALNASMDRSGQLFLQSSGSYWSDPWNPLGPFLYKVVKGDFVATVQVSEYAGTSASAVYYNSCGLMARVADDADGGAGEDWISIDYFPLYGVGNIVRYADDNVRYEDTGGNGTGWTGYTYLQIERAGNTFFLRTSSDGVTWTDYPDAAYTGLERSDLDGLSLQVGVHHATFTSSEGYAAFDEFRVEGPQVVTGMKAYGATPADEADDVVRSVVLSWTSHETVVSHDLYFGTDVDAVTAATKTDPLGVALALGQDANSYDVGLLEFGKTYYWRVDETDADGALYPGDIWLFTVEPYAYPITGVTASASSVYKVETSADKTVDGSGLDNELHGDDLTTMWLSKRNAAEPAWIGYDFGQVYKVDRVLVWNSNQTTEEVMGVGVKNATIEYSTDGSTWTTLGDVELTQAGGIGDPLPSQTVDLGGILARYVKLTILSNWAGIFKQYSLSEVRFYYVPVVARSPDPADGATDVYPQVTLGWRVGREAASHHLSLSTDEQAVIDGVADVVTVSEPEYEISLDLNQSYFWKVVEVNEAEDPTTWESGVWTFATAEYLRVDDVESYTDDMDGGEAVFQTWIDGWGDDTNGSIVGYNEPPYAEKTVVHSGRQSMPFAYANTGSAAISEAKCTFDSTRDWSLHGITALVLYFRGSTANSPAPLYIKINDTKIFYNDGADATTMPLWKQWTITLADAAVNLKSVKSLTIGVGGTGTGTLFFDDIRLYAVAPEIAIPVDPGTTSLVASYTMDGNVQDSSGKNYNGTLNGDAGYEAGYSGQALILNGINAYVDLPIGPLIASLSSATVATHVYYGGTDSWQRIFDFGSDTSVYMFLTPYQYLTGVVRFVIRTASVDEQIVDGVSAMTVGWHHVAVVIDSTTMTLNLYLDGVLVGSAATTLLPKDLGSTTQNWIGRSQFIDVDPYFSGLIDDFRIYNRALSAGELRYLAGDR